MRGGEGSKLPKTEKIPPPPLTVPPHATNISDRGDSEPFRVHGASEFLGRSQGAEN